jgi:ubiquitin C-terminal hydrolase
MDETLSLNNSTYGLLAFIIRPSSVHYTMAMKVGSGWWLHDDQRVTPITGEIKQF